MITLHGEQLWSRVVGMMVGEDQIVSNWSQGVEGSCPGDKRQVIIGPGVEMGNIWTTQETSLIPGQASYALFSYQVSNSLLSRAQ